jgi:hypothetical protein
MVSIPAPPRATGDGNVDLPALSLYVHDLFRIFVLEGLLAGDAPVVSSTELPDPASTTLAQAQQTANQAFVLAEQSLAQSLALHEHYIESGTLTIADPATTAVFTFAEEQPDTNYFVQVTGSAFSGTPLADAFIPVSIAKTTTGFTLTIAVAPGAGDSVTFDVTAFRNVTV